MIRLFTRFTPYPVVYAAGVLEGEDANHLKTSLLDLVDRGFDSISLELAEVSGIDSSGIGALLAAKGRLAQVGGALSLVSCSRRVLEDLRNTGMTDLFPVFDRPEDVPSPAN